MRLVIFEDTEGERAAINPLTGKCVVYEMHTNVKGGEPTVFVDRLERCVTVTFEEAVEKIEKALSE